MKVLMVCLGNICRSPLAEGILQHKAIENNKGWLVESAGTNGFHNGEAPHPLSQKVAKQNGIDISKQISRKFVPTDFEQYDKIYVMAADVMDDVKKIAGAKFDATKIDFFMNELHANENREVPDPWYGNEDGYVKVYKLIDETCDAILRNHKDMK
jgi:protein-tyrosine phosphatase